MTNRGIYVIPDARIKSGVRYVGRSGDIDGRLENRTDGRARADGKVLKFAVPEPIRKDVEARLIESLQPGDNRRSESRDDDLTLGERIASWRKAREIERRVSEALNPDDDCEE